MKPMNEMKLSLLSCSSNESFARAAVSAFLAQLDPTVDELCDIKTAVSEAVTNCTVHAYRGTSGIITVECRTEGNALHISIGDKGAGIADVEAALKPFFTTLPSDERSGMGFTIMQTFMDEFSIKSQVGEGTLVSMCKRFDPEVENA